VDPDTNSSDAGAAITSAAQKNGMTVQYFDGPDAIANALQSIANGSYSPAIIWVSGDGASNDLGDTGCEGPGAEGQAITDNAGAINTFVTEGGGLMSHGSCYNWLQALLPSVTTVDGGSSGDLYRTPEGLSAFPDVSDADFNAGPWHNHFEGDFGGLQVLVRSADIDDAAGNDAAVVLGGSNVDIVPPPPPPAPQVAPACSNPILGAAKGDTLLGTEGGDLIKGLLGNDVLKGLGGDDCIRGGPGRDKAKGGAGNDQLNGGQKPDKIGGGSGDDLLKVRAGRTDVVNCGSGKDSVRAGRNDIIRKNCEKVKFG
jgi:Ca2+-binding RTX toxin-like protein